MLEFQGDYLLILIFIVNSPSCASQPIRMHRNLIFCQLNPLHISRTHRTIFIKLHQNVPSVRRCAKVMTQLHRLRSRSHFNVMWFTLQFLSAPYDISWIPWTIFIELHSNVTFQCALCRAHDPARLKVTGQGIYPWISCPLHISSTLLTISFKFHPKAPLGETMCRTYDSATQIQGQGHTSKSWDLPFNSCLLHISRNPLNSFH